MSDNKITFSKDHDERYEAFRSEHVADVVWDEDLDASFGEDEISEGKWLLSHVGVAGEQELTEADGKDDAGRALAQAQRLLEEAGKDGQPGSVLDQAVHIPSDDEISRGGYDLLGGGDE